MLRQNSGPGAVAHSTASEADFDVREDEEQNVKLNQIVELLLAAGYFRARIKGLSPFDKVVGGMTWCITTCSYDVDVDLLFQENSTIGQKIALTEKIVAVLPRMKCPHRIEPHQIQGLDFIHIYPVVQWLVKRAIETRQEMGDYIRAYSVSQFDKFHTMPEDITFRETLESAMHSAHDIKGAYKPKRKFKRPDATKLTDEETRVRSTLLEYGHRRGVVKDSKGDQDESEKQKAVKSSLTATESSDASEDEEEERKIAMLMSRMMETNQQDSKLTASMIGSIVGLQSDQIQEMASHYAEKQALLDKTEKETPQVSGLQYHKRATMQLQKQIDQQKEKVSEMQYKCDELEQSVSTVGEKLNEAEEYSIKIDDEMQKLQEMETEDNKDVLERLRHLVAMNESLKKQEQEFKAHCKQEMARWNSDIDELKKHADLGLDDDEQLKLIDRQYGADQEKLQKIRLLLARKNREISTLQRRIDEVPTRAELSQYQQRFVELYNQISTKHKETKQFYTLHNTLDDTKLYLNKEVNLLNSVHDTFEQAMASTGGKEQFLKQFEQIVEGVRQNRIKLEKKKQQEKMKRDQLNDHYLDLVEKQRIYYKTIKDFKEECRKNEILLSKLKGRV